MSGLDPSRLMQIGSGYWAAKVLLSAVGLGLFTDLTAAPMTAEAVKARYGLRERPCLDFLDALVALGLLVRDGDGVGAVYRNTPETGAFLDRNSPDYIGGILELWENRNFGFWANLTEALRTGEAQSEIRESGRSFFETLYEDRAGLERFMSAMAGASRANFEAFVARFPFDRYQTHCDVGGADALLSRLVAARYPHVSSTTFDLPKVTEIAAERIAADGLSDRIAAVPGDFFRDPLPEAQVITMGMILHDWNLEQKKALIAKAFDALPRGGALVAVESLIDDARRENAFGLMLSLNMLIEFGDAFDFSGAEYREWCLEAGFGSVEILPLTATASAAVAYKV